MAKKATISELEKKIALQSVMKEEINTEGFGPLASIEMKEEDRPNVYVDAFVNGDNVYMTSCGKCGHHFKQERRYYYSRGRGGDKCPECGYESPDLIHVNGYSSGKDFIYVNSVEKTENDEIIAVLYLFSEYWHHSPTEEDQTPNNFINGSYMYCFEEKNSFMDAKYTLELAPRGCMVFSSESGLVSTDVGNTYYSIKKRNSYAYEDALRDVFQRKRYQLIESDASKELTKLLQEKYELDKIDNVLILIDEVNDRIESSRAEKRNARAKEKKVVIDEYKNYTPNEIDVVSLIQERIPKKILFMLMYNMSGINRSFKVRCSCGAEFEATSKTDYGEGIICPNCGCCRDDEDVDSSYSKGKYTSKAHTYQIIEPCTINNGLLFRRFYVTQGLSLADGYNISCNENVRIFVGKEQTLVYENQGSDEKPNWVKQRITYMNSYSYHTSTNQLNTDEELIEIIKNSDLKYSGVLDAWGLGVKGEELRIESKGAISNSTYISAWQKVPCIETVLKAGLKSIATSMISSPYSYVHNMKATNVLDILNIKKPALSIAQELNIGVHELSHLRRINNIDAQVTTELYRKIRSLGCENLLRIAENYGISFKRIFDYIESCYNNQCIENNSAIQIWMDYLKMIKDMNYTFTDKSIVYPSSLKKEHDKAVFAYRVVQNEIKTKKFKEACEAAKRLEYHYGDYLVKLPTEANEVVKEGTDLHHCVASYVTRIQDGETLICFIRKKKDPDASYFTTEVRNDSILQVRGLQNCPPPEDVVEFVEKWAAFKKLTIAYR